MSFSMVIKFCAFCQGELRPNVDAGSFFSGVEGGGGHRARLDLLGGMVCVECSNETPLTAPACFPFHRGQPSRIVTSCYVVLRRVTLCCVHPGARRPEFAP